MASELEFFLFRDSYGEARARGYRELRTAGDYVEDYHILSSTFAEPVIGAIRRGADASAIPVEFSKGEWGPGQHEINLRYAEALEMADRHVLYKTAAKEIAAAQGHSLTFMAKWHERHAGSSCHVHMSLWDAGGRPAFSAGREASPTVPPLPRRTARPRARAGLVLRADGQLVQALQRGHLRAHAHHLERRQFARRDSASWVRDRRCASSAGSPARRESVISVRRRCRGGPRRDRAQTRSGRALRGATPITAPELPRVPHTLADAIRELEGSRSHATPSVTPSWITCFHFARTELATTKRSLTDFRAHAATSSGI